MSLYRAITVDLFIYSPNEEYLTGFQLLVITNIASMNINAQIFV